MHVYIVCVYVWVYVWGYVYVVCVYVWGYVYIYMHEHVCVCHTRTHISGIVSAITVYMI